MHFIGTYQSIFKSISHKMVLLGVFYECITYNIRTLSIMFLLLRMECCDMTGIPQFSLVLTASISVTCTKEEE